MSLRVLAVLHAVIGGVNFCLAIVCAIMVVETFEDGMTSLCFFNAAILVGNLYMTYFNYCEAKRLL